MVRCFSQVNKKLNDKYRLLIAGAFISKKYTKIIRQEINNYIYSESIRCIKKDVKNAKLKKIKDSMIERLKLNSTKIIEIRHEISRESG